ncbi:MAG: DUF1592 domain-containing protein [Planctomycetaceae bacterium]|nr:DUF1592 domain-containing protein [Planctomycetaceae bacterium]
MSERCESDSRGARREFAGDRRRRDRPKAIACSLISTLLLTCAASAIAAERPSDQLATSVNAYFKQYCYRCHGASTQKGDRRLDQFPDSMQANSDAAELLEEALDAINRGDMPPTKKGVRHPSDVETARAVKAITDYLASLSDSDSERTTMLRRLNRFEYVNTMSDLLGLRKEFFSFTSDFPADAIEHGFDNNGESLTLSDHQLRRYLEVAEASLDAACFFDAQPPTPQRWRYTAKDFNGVESYERAPVTWRLIVNNEYLEIGHGQPSERHANFVKEFVRRGGVPDDGWYTVSVKAAAANRLDHGYDHAEFDRYKSEPLKMALWIAPNEGLLAKNAADQRQLMKVWDLPDGKPDVFTQRIWLDKGAIPFVSWTNGVSSKGNIRRVAEKHHPEVIRATKTQRDAAKLGNQEAKSLVAELDKNSNNKLLSEVYHGPRIRVWTMDIEGPDFPEWPPVSHQLLFGDETDAEKIDLDQVVRRFASRAFRQPVASDEVGHYVAFIQARIRDGEPSGRAIKQGMAAILTSPRFLYLDEGNDEVGAELAPHELAARLSYFLWSTMPDEELRASAASVRLLNPEELTRQVQRMLGDGRSQAFVEHFTDTWLRINTLGSMPPDPKAFEQYYNDRLQECYKTETRLFFRDLLVSNGSIVNFLESDYTFLNGPLAAQYGIQGVHGEEFRKVALEPEDHRGGLLGQGSVLTLTANGIETSPVVRGIWVLENILGTPPPPPPPDVEPLEPDTRGTTTIREQLDKHRSVATCAECHRRIDPAGFALEFFDPIGGYRTRYPARGNRGPEVNGSGQLPSGESFEDERGLKKLLVARKDRFAETLTEKLLTYATGRRMTFRDQAEIKRIAMSASQTGYGLRDLIIGVATSETFRQR